MRVGMAADEGRWAVLAGAEESVPAPSLSAAPYNRFSARGVADFADKLLSRIAAR